MNRLWTFIILTLSLALIAANSCGQEWDGQGQLIRLTPAIPGGEPFPQQVELPGEMPEPSSVVAVGVVGVLLLTRRHARD